jgi:hypothetical protein
MEHWLATIGRTNLTLSNKNVADRRLVAPRVLIASLTAPRETHGSAGARHKGQVSMSMRAPAGQPGWLPDSADRFESQYWDGTHWTHAIVKSGRSIASRIGAPSNGFRSVPYCRTPLLQCRHRCHMLPCLLLRTASPLLLQLRPRPACRRNPSRQPNPPAPRPRYGRPARGRKFLAPAVMPVAAASLARRT